MPNIEILPNSTKEAATPGWAYVLDTGLDPSKQAIVPSGARKRARIANYAADAPASNDATSVSSREQTRINKHIAELDKENHRDVQIVIPNRPKDVAQRGMRNGKMTPGVKKIMLSQKTWVNYLADEEAEIALKGYHQPLPPAPTKAEHIATQTVQTPVVKPKGKVGRPPGKKKSLPNVKVTTEPMEIDQKVAATIGIDHDRTLCEPANADTTTAKVQPDIEYLIATDTPRLPTAAGIEALLSQTPLSYNAARAAPTRSTAPKRLFCEICGYWGRVMCMKCGVRICSLECKNTHDETRCAKFFA